MQKYSQFAKLLKQCNTQNRSLKNIIFSHTNDPIFIRQAYALITKALKNSQILNDILITLEDKHPNSIRDPYLIIILILELFNPAAKNKKIGGALTRILKSNHDLIQGLLQQYRVFEDNNPNSINIRLILCNLGLEQKNQFLNLLPCPDSHVPNLYTLDYEKYQQLKQQNLNSDWFVVQSKASAMPPFLLLRSLKQIQFKKPRFDIIDCCAAPGNKTLQLAEFIKSQAWRSKVLAFERSKPRYQILKQRIKQYGFQHIVKCFNKNFLEVNVNDKCFKYVRLIMLDPSCSGSGMLQQRMVEQQQQDKDILKINSLAVIQLQLLNKCAQFPKVIRIIYSTCSIYEEENEQVANRFLQTQKQLQQSQQQQQQQQQLQQQQKQWQSVNLFKEWQFRGTGDNNNYVRFSPERDNTDGFFIALFKRRFDKIQDQQLQ